MQIGDLVKNICAIEVPVGSIGIISEVGMASPSVQSYGFTVITVWWTSTNNKTSAFISEVDVISEYR